MIVHETLPIVDASAALARALDGELRYATVWEDQRLLRAALPIHASDDVLVVASAGCNAFDLLLAAPRRVYAVDFNRAQTALVELKREAFAILSHPQVLDLLGVTARTDRVVLYDLVRPGLSHDARAWWDANLSLLERGIETSGRLERFIAGFRDAHLAAPETRRAIDTLFETDARAARARLLDEQILTPPVVAAFRSYFTREALDRRGRSPEQTRQVPDVDTASYFLSRLRWVCTALPTRDNVYLRRFLGARRTGEPVQERDLPPYLRARNFGRVRAALTRLAVINGDVGGFLAERIPGSLGHAAMSDVFEYLEPTCSDALFAALARALRTGGRVAYWNLFVPRARPASLAGELRPLEALASALFARDRAWFYSAFHVEERCAA